MRQFDEGLYFLGNLCNSNHDFENTGKSLRYHTSRRCVYCDKARHTQPDNWARIRISVPDGFKECSSCLEVKPLELFSPRKDTSDGKQSRCKACRAADRHKSVVKKPCKYQPSREGYRICSKCLQELTEDNFNKDGRGGLKRECRHCEKLRKAETASKHPDKLKEQRKRYAENMTDEQKRRRNEYKTRYRKTEAYQNGINRWRNENADYVREYAKRRSAERRARVRGLPNNFKVHHERRMMDYFNHSCAVCGHSADLWLIIAIDHWIPLNSLNCPGTVPTNLVPLCHSKAGGIGGCNRLKGDKEPEQWLVEQFGKRKAREILKRIEAYFEWVKQFED